MNRFWRNCRGAVTVMVTLLLIPAVLISGSAVDISRIYSARSILQDANQMAANGVLASYNADLKDFYGLYGVMNAQGDAKLSKMIDDYIEACVFGEEPETGLGTWQLFYGAELENNGLEPMVGQNLGNISVLRRQIEEYAKLRAPVILVNQLLDRINQFKNVGNDAKIIKYKMKIDNEIEDLKEIYQKVYNQIQKVNRCYAAENAAFNEVNSIQEKIYRTLFTEGNSRSGLLQIRDDYTDFMDQENKGVFAEEKKADFFSRYEAVQNNVKSLVSGGSLKKNWKAGKENEDGSWVKSEFQDEEQVELSLEDCLKKWENSVRAYLSELDQLIEICEKADQKKQELSEKVDELEQKLNQEGSCSDTLKAGLNEPDDSGMSAIEYYRALLKYNIKDMATAMRGHNGPQIQAVADMLNVDKFVYGNRKWGSTQAGDLISLTNLKDLKHIEKYDLDWRWKHKSEIFHGSDDPLDQLCRIGPSLSRLEYPQRPDDSSKKYEFELFHSSEFDGTHNAEFYTLLEDLCNSSGNDTKDQADAALSEIFKYAKEILDGLFDYNPEGAWVFRTTSGDVFANDETGLLGPDEEWDTKKAEAAMNSSLIDKLAKIADDISNYALLLTYDSEMFSCWTTPAEAKKQGSNAGQAVAVKTMTGKELSKKNNYFYQSELEYIFSGTNDARSNLAKVSGMMLLVRFVFNYISSFRVKEVRNIINSVREACSALGPFAFVIGELVRAALCMGESAMDLSRLRTGHQVALVKGDLTWRFSVQGITNMISGSASSIVNGTDDEAKKFDDTDPSDFPMTYKDYMRIFLIFVGGDTLAVRTKKLIEFNLTNLKLDIDENADHTVREAAMSGAELVDLSRACTSFSITTTAELKMLFLSMPFAGNAIAGASPPGTVPVTATDYRGY